MITEILAKQFETDLGKLKKEISLYQDEANLWLTPNQVNNSAGNLCLHLAGNLQHFIGAVLGDSGYVRDRENEFSARGISREKLLAEVDRAQEAVAKALAGFNEADLENTYPIEVFGHPTATGYFLIHLKGHLSYHLGQISYHRRIMEPAG